jgi:hypothetical protein
MIVQATMVPLRGALRGLCMAPTFTWNPVVRLTARQGVAGQLGTVGGVVAGSEPTSVSVAGATAGSTSASATLANTAMFMRLIFGIQHRSGPDVAVALFR